MLALPQLPLDVHAVRRPLPVQRQPGSSPAFHGECGRREPKKRHSCKGPLGRIMGYAENRGGYWRGRYKTAPGRYATVVDGNGATVKFRTRREAEQAANDAEARVRNGGRPPRAAGR